MWFTLSASSLSSFSTNCSLHTDFLETVLAVGFPLWPTLFVWTWDLTYDCNGGSMDSELLLSSLHVSQTGTRAVYCPPQVWHACNMDDRVLWWGAGLFPCWALTCHRLLTSADFHRIPDKLGHSNLETARRSSRSTHGGFQRYFRLWPCQIRESVHPETTRPLLCSTLNCQGSVRRPSLEPMGWWRPSSTSACPTPGE